MSFPPMRIIPTSPVWNDAWNFLPKKWGKYCNISVWLQCPIKCWCPLRPLLLKLWLVATISTNWIIWLYSLWAVAIPEVDVTSRPVPAGPFGIIFRFSPISPDPHDVSMRSRLHKSPRPFKFCLSFSSELMSNTAKVFWVFVFVYNNDVRFHSLPLTDGASDFIYVIFKHLWVIFKHLQYFNLYL